MPDVVMIEYRDDWETVGSLAMHAAVPGWPRWIASRKWTDTERVPTCCLTQYLDRQYDCQRSRRNDPNAPPYKVKLHPLTPCPSGWSWSDLTGIDTESTDTFDELPGLQVRMMQNLPELLALVDPAILNRPDWDWAGHERFIGAHWSWKKYIPESGPQEHEHCRICWAMFSVLDENGLRAGYARVDDHDPKLGEVYEWICKTCFDDLKDLFKWVVVE
jgi:hypothetical protein